MLCHSFNGKVVFEDYNSEEISYPGTKFLHYILRITYLVHKYAYSLTDSEKILPINNLYDLLL